MALADRVPRTARGQATLAGLLRSAEEVLGERGYEATSVSGICRRAGLAQGTFYLYFTSKEDVYVHLVKGLQGRVIACVNAAAARAQHPDEALLKACDALIDQLTADVRLFQVFREAEFVRPEIPKRFYEAVCKEIAGVVKAGMDGGVFRAVDSEVVAYATLGILFFVVLRYVLWGDGVVPASVRRELGELLLRGIDSGCRASSPRLELIPPPSPSRQSRRPACEGVNGAEATRAALLDAAERTFGEAGFHKASVSTITYLAGVAQGTFYLHFPSKVTAFNELVDDVSRQFLRGQAMAVAGISDRREVEAMGLCCFFQWIKDHPGAYRILREAEFVDDHVGKQHYQRLAQGYAKGLASGMERGEIRRCDPEALSFVMQGIAHFSGQRWVLWKEPDRSVEEDLSRVIDFVLHGLASRL